MINFFKYFKLLGLFQDAVTAYKEEKGKDNVPVILHRRFFGAVIFLAGTAVGIYYGISSDIFTGHLTQIVESADKIIGAGLALYGIIQMIVGAIGAKKRDATTG